MAAVSDHPICFLANQADVGGGEVMLVELAAAAASLGREVRVVGFADSPALTLAESHGLATEGIAATSRRTYLTGLARWAGRRRELLWCNGLVPALGTAGHANRVVHLHQLPVGVHRHAARLALPRARAVVVPSHFMAERIPGALALPNWSPEVIATSTPRPAQPTVIGFLGRLSSDKGVPTLAEAIRILNRRHPDRFTLYAAGESRFVAPDDQGKVEAALTSLGPHVVRPGWISREDFFGAVDLAVFPSEWPEPFGLMVTEAMSARVPFVVSSAGALPEVAGADYPYVAQPGDPSGLADVIEHALSDPNLPAVTAAARDRWETAYSPEVGRARFAALLASHQL